jgi:hypothetical protein
MKIKMFMASLALALSLASANQLLAQVTLDKTGPAGSIGWSSSATLCKILPGSAPSTLYYPAGTVTFGKNNFGTIGLICSMPGIVNGNDPRLINNVAFSFSNPNDQYGCSVSVYFVDRTTGLSNGWASDRSRDFSGIWTANVGLNGNTLPLTNHTYDVDIYLYRPRSGINLCNPIAYSAFMEQVR